MNRHITFDRLHNFRDIGGYRTADGGVVRWGRLYRADSLSKLAGRDWERFLDLDVRTVIDLRYPWEISARGRVPHSDGLAYHNLSIEHRTYDQASIDPALDPSRFLADRYAEVAADGIAELRRSLEIIADPDAGPIVIHCASGKDRTGLLAALVLALVGVSDDDVIADFTLTGLATERLLADWHAANPGRTMGWPAYGTAPADIMRLFLTELTVAHGSVEGYATGALGVDGTVIAALRDHLVESAAAS